MMVENRRVQRASGLPSRSLQRPGLPEQLEELHKCSLPLLRSGPAELLHLQPLPQGSRCCCPRSHIQGSFKTSPGQDQA
jgi:hypothetical protein